MRVGIVLSRFNPAIGELLLKGAARALEESGVGETGTVVVTVPGALESPLALQRMAQTGEYDALVALGAVIRGETYHFEVVANESAAGVASVQLEFGIPIGNGILTTDTDEQAKERAEAKGRDAVLAAVEMANLLAAIDDQ
jgi:6,7-dimethyl-8-ribityllumazine synthase